MSKQDRIVWVDAAKGFAIVLMVFGHVWRGLFEAGILGSSIVYESIDRAIYLFHMPLFFFLSGMFVSTSASPADFGGRLIKRAEAYLYPLVIWSWLLALSRVAAGSATNREPLTLWDAALYPFPPKDIFWFLWALFLIQTVVACALLLPKRWQLWIGIGAAIGALAYTASGLNLPLTHDAIVNLPYFLAGTALAAVGGLKIGSGRQAFLGFALFAVAELVALLPPDRPTGPIAVVDGMIAVFGVVLIVAWLCNLFRASKLTEAVGLLGTATMAIYVTHVVILAAIRIGLVKLGFHNVLVHVVVATVAATTLPLLLLQVASRWRLNRLLALGPGLKTDPRKQRALASVGHPTPLS